MRNKYLVIGLVGLGLLGVGCASEKHEQAEENEVDLKQDQLPPAVMQTIQKESEGGALSEFEQGSKEGKTYYEADAAIGDKTYEIRVADDGTLLKKSLEAPEKDEKDSDKPDKD